MENPSSSSIKKVWTTGFKDLRKMWEGDTEHLTGQTNRMEKRKKKKPIMEQFLSIIISMRVIVRQ